ncbi:hypothetical protein D770_05220 [Flammeovirgaceae bacterium 311]|nr:hypothetical protein D770_05220 [Flammeovirgaceae bacterium 311]
MSVFNDEPEVLLYYITVPILIDKLTQPFKKALKPNYGIEANYIDVAGEQYELLTLFYELKAHLNETVSYLKNNDANMMKDCGVVSLERAKQGLEYVLSLLPLKLIRGAKIQKALTR